MSKKTAKQKSAISEKTERIAYEGVAKTLNGAISAAHDKIPGRKGFDFAVSRVIEFGMQTGGFINERLYWVTVVEEQHSPFRKKD